MFAPNSKDVQSTQGLWNVWT